MGKLLEQLGEAESDIGTRVESLVGTEFLEMPLNLSLCWLSTPRVKSVALESENVYFELACR